MSEEMAPPRSSGFTDPGWEHGVSQDEKKKKVKCNYCGKIVSGGIYRLKQHLARISGEVTFCRKAPQEVCVKMKENLAGSQAIKKHCRYEDDDQASFDLHSNDDNEEADESGDYKQAEKQGNVDKSLVVNSAPLRSLGYVDPGWEHGIAQDTRKKKVKCNYCEKIVSGGINRFKQHLARIPGEVASCKMAPDEVYLRMKENMKWHRTGRRRQSESDMVSFYDNSDNDETGDGDLANGGNKISHLFGDQLLGRSNGSGTSGSDPQVKQMKTEPSLQKTQKSTALPHKQAIKAENEKKIHREAISAISKFFYHAAVPLNAANSPYFHRMLDLVSQYGQGWKSPSSRLLSGRLLQEEVLGIRQHQLEIKTSWMVTGCTIMADRCQDMQNRTFINFLVSCPRGTSFISSVAASEIIEDAPSIFNLLDKIVEEVVTESSPIFRAAGRMLEEKRKNLFWMPCAAYSVDRVLEDFIKIKLVEESMGKAQKITRLIYNHSWLLNLMKKEFMAGRELVQTAATKSSASFLTLQCLLECRNALKRMFQSSKWVSSRFANMEEGKEVQKIVLNSTFWKKIQYIRKSVDPVLQVLLKVEGDRDLSLPFIYNDMYKAKLAIKEIHGDDERKYEPFWMAIDNHLNSHFHHPLCAAAYFLNPSFRYRADFLGLPEVIRGVNECIVRMEPDSARRISASMQIADFVSAKDDFGTELAISTRTELDPAVWWQQHGINCLELQRIAIRILSQTCSSSGRDLHGPNLPPGPPADASHRNRLAQKRGNDLLFVHYNLRLRERQLARGRPDEPPGGGGGGGANAVFLEDLLDGWICDAERPAIQEDEEMLYEETEAIEGEENGDLEAEIGRSAAPPFPEIVEPLDFQHGVDCGGPTDDDDDASAAAAGEDADLDFFGDE
ncbi:unnamed protein product [Spirodela intermedia]|uniref:BED-type domain-containing protein n=1 Tax=Spirodela intermedia TaxID=51605 RepID=A0A7I8IYT1_SPIIN|nr:unnamed protein product [Spirodela intermedia]CAA6662172.1 unnamed protein product [Spirodela intermedia]